jgi:peptidyl-prolyl cis-trans isomerase SurA
VKRVTKISRESQMKQAVYKPPFIASLVLGCSVLFCATAVFAEKPLEPLDRIVAVVNNEVITALELDREMVLIKNQLAEKNNRMPPDAVLKKQLLERLILREIQLQMAKRGSIRVDDETLNHTLDNIAAQNRLSLAQFREVLGREGLDYEAFRENIRSEITINQLQQRQVRNRIVVTKQEIDDFLNNQALREDDHKEYRLGHILVGLPEAPSAEQIAAARLKAQQIVKQLQAGADFYQTAVSLSDGQQALEGGDLGLRRAAALPTLFADWATSHELNSVSNELRSPSGFHIIKLLEISINETKHLITQTHTRHILVRPDALDEGDEARERVLKIRQRIVNGEDFAALAKIHSDDPGSGMDGGELGWVSPGEMVPGFEKAMDMLATGELSEPVRTKFGWHLLEVLERRSHDDTDKVLRKKAQEALRARKTEPAMQTWVRRLRDEAYVENRL